MNDPDGMVQTIREQEKHIADLELRLKLRDKRIEVWMGIADDLYIDLMRQYFLFPAEANTASLQRYEEAQRYGSQ